MEILTEKELSVYLPYQLEMRSTELPLEYGHVYLTVTGEEPESININDAIEYGYKPILWSSDYLTKPIQHEGREFVPLVELAKIAFPHHNWKIGNYYNTICAISEDTVFTFTDGSFYAHDKTQRDIDNQIILFQKLAEWHINFLGIPNELFINKAEYGDNKNKQV